MVLDRPFNSQVFIVPYLHCLSKAYLPDFTVVKKKKKNTSNNNTMELVGPLNLKRAFEKHQPHRSLLPSPPPPAGASSAREVCFDEADGLGRFQLGVWVLIGVLFGCVGRKIDGDSWFTWWLHHLPGKPIYVPQKDAYGCTPFFSWCDGG